jgi:hypothetical protein
MNFLSSLSGRPAAAWIIASAATWTSCCPPTILTEQLPVGRVGEHYHLRLEAECWGAQWWVSGELPPGMSFTHEGVLHGIPRYAGVYFLTIGWDDVYEGEIVASVSRAYDLIIVEEGERLPPRDERNADPQ